MHEASVQICNDSFIGRGAPLTIFSGPCVIEDLQTCKQIADRLQGICLELGLTYVFKASFDKANRSSVDSFRGPGMEDGLAILSQIKEECGIPVMTDIHEPAQAAPVSEVADIVQIPAFLCRQTDLLTAAGRCGKPVNIKKGQFMAPYDMKGAVEKVQSTGNMKTFLTERGTSFGYHELVVDMRSLWKMRELNVPVIFDATHSVQRPAASGKTSGGEPESVFPLTRAAAATGIDGLFMEVHPAPENALSDGANSIPLHDVSTILTGIKRIHELDI